jgi:cyclomaltodextrinase / maltogenic alpha-amylase / neopullulanase
MKHSYTPIHSQSRFYHLYPLSCGQGSFAPFYSVIPHMHSLHLNALFLGPVFQSDTHGYDTSDYYTVDNRLGTNEELQQFIGECHRQHISVVLDGVFHHTGKNFFAFQDILQKGKESKYRHWYFIDFERPGAYHTPFYYEGWNGHYDLVKLNVLHPEVQEYLFKVIAFWVDYLGIDGIRLDAADVLEPSFLEQLAQFCHTKQPDFWLLGEVIHGDYRQWTQYLNSVTNYELYKGLWSSLNEDNFFEIAYSLNRQFGEQGIYQNSLLYSFADNHDVNRIASTLHNPAHLHLLYLLLFTMPGIPSIYYGSEWGIHGTKQPHSDAPLRPHLTWPQPPQNANHSIYATLQTCSSLRQQYLALSIGAYRQLLVQSMQFAFLRSANGEHIIVVLNAHTAQTTVHIALPPDLLPGGTGIATDVLNHHTISINNHSLACNLWPCWGAIFKIE